MSDNLSKRSKVSKRPDTQKTQKEAEQLNEDQEGQSPGINQFINANESAPQLALNQSQMDIDESGQVQLKTADRLIVTDEEEKGDEGQDERKIGSKGGKSNKINETVLEKVPSVTEPDDVTSQITDIKQELRRNFEEMRELRATIKFNQDEIFRSQNKSMKTLTDQYDDTIK